MGKNKSFCMALLVLLLSFILAITVLRAEKSEIKLPGLGLIKVLYGYELLKYDGDYWRYARLALYREDAGRS